MATVGIRDLRAALATHIRRANAGERLVVTVDGAPVAQLGPVISDHTGASIDALIARGAVHAPRRRGDFVPPDPLTLVSGARVDRALREIRA